MMSSLNVMTDYPFARITNAFSDPQSKVSLAQDELVRISGEDGTDWFKIETLTGTNGRCPKILAKRLAIYLRSSSERLVVALADFQGQESGDLSFAKDQLIVVERDIDENWLCGVVVSDNGKRLGKSAIFPVNYVQNIVGVPVGAPPPSSVEDVVSPRNPPSVPTISARSAVSINDTIGPYARSAFPFQSEFSNELSFSSDEVIRLRRRVDSDWMEGELNGRVGIFPVAYVQIIVDLPSDNNGSARGGPSMANDDGDGIGFATVKHMFLGQEKDELSVQAGDSVRVLRMIDTEWAQCRDPSSEKVGIVPMSFLELYLDDEGDDSESVDQSNRTIEAGWSFSAQSMSDTGGSSNFESSFGGGNSSMYSNTSSSVMPPANTSSSSTSTWAKFEDWNLASSDDKKPAPARPPPPKSIQSTPTSPEKTWTDFDDASSTTQSSSPPTSATTSVVERNRVLDELISSEQAFVTDMTALEKAVSNSTKLSDKHKKVLCSGIPQIVELSLLLADTLKIEKDKQINNQNIGEVFLNFQKMFAQAYGYFFRNIETINGIVENRSDKKLQSCLNDILLSMKSYGSNCFDVPTAVGRPVHRALKYPLFISEIIKHTGLSHPDHPKLLEALKQMSNLGQKMNESKRRKELTRKYSEEQSASFTQKLSRLNVHSVVKKGTRFKYRMGTAFGILHLTKDAEFDQLIHELDQSERRLVRFNYQLVIYQKKMHHDMKRQVDVLIIAPIFPEFKGKSAAKRHEIKLDASKINEKSAFFQLKPFFDMLNDFCKETNFKVKDDCLKAIRVIPKKLVQKRNDKLMDYEAAKKAMKSSDDVNARFRDFDALNQQVKSTLPKVIDVMNQVLRQGMQTLEDMDTELMRSFREKFEAEQLKAVNNLNALITPNTICFVELMDKNRLNNLKQIANKASSTSFSRPLKSSLKKKGSFDKRAKDKDSNPYVPPSLQTSRAFDEALTSSTRPSTPSSITKQPTATTNAPTMNPAALDAIWKAAAAPAPVPPSTQKKFRAQTEVERKTLLAKADAKGRRADVYRCLSEWPASVEARESSEQTGRMLITRTGDVILAVKKEAKGLWLCYNGYYNGFVPSGLITPYYDRPGTNIGEPISLSEMGLLETKVNMSVDRPKSTPPSKMSNRDLLDLLDDIVPPLQSVPALVPQNTSSALSPSFSQQSSSSNMATPNVYPSLFDNTPSINWGATPMQPLVPSQALQPVQTTPLVPMNVTPLQPSPAPSSSGFSSFPTLSPQPPPSNFSTPSLIPSGLPPMHPSQNGMNRNPSKTSPNEDAFSKLWDEVKSMPLSKVRSESPQPLMPTRRPAPAEGSASYSSPPMYTQPPTYDQPPGWVSFYDEPPDEAQFSASNPFASMGVAYDTPPTYSLTPTTASSTTSSRQAPPPPQSIGLKKDHPIVVAEFDFTPVGENQLMIREGERLSLLQKHDDDGNPEWILVKRANGDSGYVPSAYINEI